MPPAEGARRSTPNADHYMKATQISPGNEVNILSELLRSCTIQGKGNKISIGANCRVQAHIEILGDNNRLTIEDEVQVKGHLVIKAPYGGSIHIGRNTTIGGGAIQVHEPAEIAIGQDCMFSSELFISASDIHPIYDRSSGERANPAKSIRIGNHVWLGYRTIVQKGADIADGAVIGAGSVVTGEIPAYTLAAGVPARVLRENIDWRRDFPPESAPADGPAPIQQAPAPLIPASASAEQDESHSWRNQASQWREVKPSGRYERLTPNLVNFKSKHEALKQHIVQELARPSVATPAEDLYLLENAVIADIGLVYTQSGELFGPSVKDHWQLYSMEALKALDPREIPVLDGVAVYIFKSGKDNYGHLLTEILPKLENVLLMGINRATLVLPYLPEPLATSIPALITRLYGDRFMFYQMQHPLLRVKHLVYPGPVSRHNLRKSATLLSFAERLLAAAPKDAAGPKRIYVSRERVAKRRMVNEPQVREFFEGKGYVAVHPQELGILEQAQLFRDAEAIVGPTGAAMTNALFAPQGCRVSMLDPGLYDYFFFDLCSLKRQPFTWTFGRPLEPMTQAMLEEDYQFPKSLLHYALP
jgi:acetyltransferase-like isoleucine patch superfamily enzyme